MSNSVLPMSLRAACILLLAFAAPSAPSFTPSARAQATVRYYCPIGKHYLNKPGRCPTHGAMLVAVSKGSASTEKKAAEKKTAASNHKKYGATSTTKAVVTAKSGGSTEPSGSATSSLRSALNASDSADADEIAPRITAAVNRGANVNVTNAKGRTALMWAAVNDQASLARLLLGKGAQIGLKDNDGLTALMFAASKSSTVTRLLVQKGVSVDQSANGGVTALMLSCLFGNEESASLLVGAGANVNARTSDGDTPLKLAVGKGHAGLVRLLASKGANVNYTFNEEKFKNVTPLLLVARDEDIENRTEIAQILIEYGASVNAADSIGHTPLHYAAQQDNVALARILLAKPGVVIDKQCVIGYTPLMEAAADKGPRVAKLLIEAGANTTIKDKDGKTALEIAQEKESDEVATLLNGSAPRKVANNEGAGGRPPDEGEFTKGAVRGTTPDKPAAPAGGATGQLVEALNDTSTEFAQRFATMKLAIEAGADINARSKDGQTALYQATNTGNAEAVKYLLDKKADGSIAEGKGGRVPIHLAAVGTDTAILKLMLDEGSANVNAKDSDGWTPLMYAALTNASEATKMLLAAGADPSLGAKDGATALHVAARALGPDYNVDGFPEVVEILLDSKKVSVDAKTNLATTPLMYAAAYGRVKAAESLIARGADVNAKSQSGLTPLSAAQEPPSTAKDDIKKSRLSDDQKTKKLEALDANYKAIADRLKTAGAKE